MVKLRTFLMAMVACLFVLEGVLGICNVSSDAFTACEPAMRTEDPVDQPSDACCAGLQTADFQCLCQYKDSFWLKRMQVDPQRAMQLPTKCSIPNAPTQCVKVVYIS
ncbi:hypothetical protein LUZ60_002756 [Juncus effusus]|nr:hypothetical protein LUZ60_002756 [Juncus effusus]